MVNRYIIFIQLVPTSSITLWNIYMQPREEYQIGWFLQRTAAVSRKIAWMCFFLFSSLPLKIFFLFDDNVDDDADTFHIHIFSSANTSSCVYITSYYKRLDERLTNLLPQKKKHNHTPILPNLTTTISSVA